MTVEDIITAAFREGNLKSIGTTPTSAEQTEGLDKLNRIISGWYGHEIGVELQDWPVIPPQRTASVAAQYPRRPFKNDLASDQWPYPPSNVRLMHSADAAKTVYLQHNPRDGARLGYAKVGATVALTIDGNGRNIESATTLSVDPSSVSAREWFFRADLGDWKRIATLATTDGSPFPAEFDDLLVVALAIGLSPRFGVEPLSATVQAYRDGMAKLKARYRQPFEHNVTSGDLPPLSNTYYDSHDLLGT